MKDYSGLPFRDHQRSVHIPRQMSCGMAGVSRGQQPEQQSAVAPSGRTRVLFLSSPERPGADTFIHALLMRGLDRSRFDVHVACSAGEPGARTPAFDALAGIAGLHIRPSNFGPSLSGRTKIEQAALLVRELPALASFVSLAHYVRQHRISVLHSTDRPLDAMACALL